MRLFQFLFLKLRLRKETIERIKTSIQKGESYNDKFIFLFFLFNSIFILVFMLFNMYFISELNNNIDSYVDVYNYIHNKCPIDKV